MSILKSGANFKTSQFAQSLRQAQIIRVADSILLKEPGPYMLYVTEGEYNVAAFIDFNENLLYESDDFAGWHGMPDTASVKAEQVMSGLDIIVSEKIEKYAELNSAKLMKISYYPLSRFSKCINGECINGRGKIVVIANKTWFSGPGQRQTRCRID